MKIDAISFSGAGNTLNLKIAGLLHGDAVTCWGKGEGLLPYTSLADFAQKAFFDSDALIFIGGAGIAVRAIAPHIRAKDRDPAVLVIDDTGAFVIPILSGHIGGANRLAERLAPELGALAVITTGTDRNGVFAADTWAAENNCRVADTAQIKHISAALLRGETVGFLSDFPVTGRLPKGLVPAGDGAKGIVVSIDENRRDFHHTLHIVPRCIHLGIGCRKHISPQAAEAFVQKNLAAAGISPMAVKAISSIQLKEKEPALTELAKTLNCPFHVYSAEELEKAAGEFKGSEFVRSVTGTDNVCQRACTVSSGGGRIVIEKTAENGITFAASIEDWRAVF